MIVLMLIAVALIPGLSVLAYTLAVHALPFMLGVEVAKWAYASGSGLIGAGLVVLFIVVRSPILRLAVALIFAAPAAVAGFALVHGIIHEAVPSEVWQTIFCLISGGITSLSALMRLVGASAALPSI